MACAARAPLKRKAFQAKYTLGSQAIKPPQRPEYPLTAPFHCHNTNVAEIVTQEWTSYVADWQNKLRLSSDYGWTLDNDRKPVRTDRFAQRDAFAQELQAHLQSWLKLSW